MDSKFRSEFGATLDYNKFAALNLLCSYVEDMLRINNVEYSPTENIDEKQSEK